MKYIVKIIIGICAVISFADAGVVMKTQFETPKEKTSTHTIYADKEHMLMDITTKDKPDMSIIFRSDKNVFWMVDHKKKSYTELTKEDLEKMAKAMEQVGEMLDKALDNMPPELKAKMEAMMKPQTKEAPKIIYKKVASGEKVNQWVCDKYEETRDDKKVAEIWTTDPKKLDIKSEDLKVLAGMGKFFQTMLKNMPFNIYEFSVEKAQENMFAGMPIKTIGYEKDKQTYKSELKELKREEFKISLFEVPQEYKKEKIETEEGKDE